MSVRLTSTRRRIVALLMAISLGCGFTNCRPPPKKPSPLPPQNVTKVSIQGLVDLINNAESIKDLNTALLDLAKTARTQAQFHITEAQSANTPTLLVSFAPRPKKKNKEVGVLIDSVFPLGAADIGGLEKGDRITHLEGKPLLGDKEVLNRVLHTPKGQSFKVTYLREGKQRSTTLTPYPIWGYKGPLPEPKLLPSQGKGPRTLVLFSDPACPSCFAFFPQIRRFRQNLKGSKLIYVPYQTEFQHSDQTLNLAACALSKKVEFWNFQDHLYTLGQGLNPNSMASAAKEFGVSTSEQPCDGQPELKEWKKAFARMGVLYRAGAAPSLFVDGKIIDPRRIRVLMEN